MHENEIGKLIISKAFEVHSNLGAGLLESIYQTCLAYELINCGMTVETQIPMPVEYKGIRMECGYRIDLRVDKKVIVEIKSVDAIHPVHLAQVMTYLKLTGDKLGYILNFNEPHLKNGIQRVVLGQL